ncbi:hypothetical protein HELRODRAFT_167728 [Helobdella robusta]|uniref:MARVEL domain-containing protein n=1 Tax=Helobdella robusta TaxID=6412 RepID=T1EZQ5_HELRO|nr:hypothetical protein HELRODRAFT_167728 [Helobdella robusta]ESO09909.1 hypothetical protein HELRODRAFT_167728 [Helobdella robusta]
MDAGRSAYNSYGQYGGINEFDLISFLKKPLVLLRIIAIIFSIVVFGCIATNQNGKGCPYVDGGACGYGSGVGVVAFLALIAFLVLDAMFDNISDVNNRKYIVISELAFNGVALTTMSLARYRRGSLDDFMPFTVPPSYPDSQISGNSGY